MCFFKKVANFQPLLIFSTEQGLREFYVTIDRLFESPLSDFMGTRIKPPLLQGL